MGKKNGNIGKERKAKQRSARELSPNAMILDCIASRWTNAVEPGEGKNTILCQWDVDRRNHGDLPDTCL